MPWSQLLLLLKQGGPRLLKALPKLWPLLMDPKTRSAILDAARDLASQSPTKRLRGRVNGTVAVAQGIATDATSDEREREVAETWARRGRNLARKLDMPLEGRGAKAANREAVKLELAKLQGEMEQHLGTPPAG